MSNLRRKHPPQPGAPRRPPKKERPLGAASGPTMQPVKSQPIRPQPSKPQPSKPTDWSGVSEWYDNLVGDEGSEYQREVVLPGVGRLLGLKNGDRCVDVACGQGVLCRYLGDLGVHMTGVDSAAPLIHAAKARSKSDANTEYHVGDARELSFLPEAAFDAAACVLAIQNINPIGPVFTGVARALKPWGRVALVMMHPCFRGPKETEWGWDDRAGVQYRRVDRYLLPRKSPIVTHPGKDPDTYTWTFHKPIEAYVRALRGAGLLVDAIEEWPSHKTSTSGPRAGAENAARKEIPMFMAIRAVKVSGATKDADAGE